MATHEQRQEGAVYRLFLGFVVHKVSDSHARRHTICDDGESIDERHRPGLANMTNRGPSVVLGGVQWGPDRYPTLWVYEDGQYYSFSLQRCVAYAHGKLDALRFEDDPREVHHINEDKWDNDPSNLEPLPPEKHAQITNGTHA